MPMRASVIFINKQKVWRESNLLLKTSCPYVIWFRCKHIQSLTTMSQVPVFSSDLKSVCICERRLPLLPIKAQRILSVCPQLNPDNKNNTNFGGEFDFFFFALRGVVVYCCSIWAWRSQAFPLTLASWPSWPVRWRGQRKPFPFNSAHGALYGTWPCAPLNLLDLRPDVHDLEQISLHAFSGWDCWLRGCGTTTTQPD